MTSLNTLDGSLTAVLSPPSKNESLRSMSRSPHPYHRRSSSLQQVQRPINQLPEKYSESSDSTESEERATEADDEKGPILKGLPAPPLRGRKGLKGSRTPADVTPAISPFPTPPGLKERRSSYFAAEKPRKASRVEAEIQDQAVEAYKKYVRRRRLEVARRATETVLLGLIGAAACKDAFCAAQLDVLRYHLLGSVAALTLLYLLFPLRIAVRCLQSGRGLYDSLRIGFHVPSVFDPGSLLYPVFLPFLIAVSLFAASPDILVTNLILGLSSLPQKVIPGNNSYAYQSVHWAVALSPMYSRRFTNASAQSEVMGSGLVDPESAVLLYPLHQAILATLKYLTSTSLDPAEIQLLATGLINLYSFTQYPQAEILKALLWVGALCLFVSCQKPLSWEVRIARVPSWKFARNKSPTTGLMSVSENLLNMLLPRHRYSQTHSLGSDDEDYEHLKSARRMAKNQMRLRRARTGGPQSDFDPIASEKELSLPSINGLKRSWTVSAKEIAQPASAHRRRHMLNVPTTGLLSFTYAQAQACKWLIAAYVYATVATVILVIVRSYVSARALSSHEPFGWALGYLFGDIQPLRLWVVSNNLETWISLPRHVSHQVASQGMGWIEAVRQTQLGPANTRLLLAGYCIVVLTLGIGTVLQLGTVVEVDTRRKVFHGTMVAMLLPTVFVDPCFTALALILILAVFLLLDLFRASQLPPISKPLTTFLAPYVDGRDYRGPVIVSHIFLLIGCAIPLWLSLAGMSRTGDEPWLGWDSDKRDMSMISGIVCVGMGDAAASLIGRRYGRTKWVWSGGKSLEGSAAFALAVTIGLASCYIWLRVGGWVAWEMKTLPLALCKMVVAGCGASILESVLTAGNDNVIVPIGLWLLTRGLHI